MSFSIYYEAKREKNITKEEQITCYKIVEKYCLKYPFEEKVEDFGVYDMDSETGIIFAGSTKLPEEGPEILFEVANYWLECLTDITNVLPDCEWSATFEEVDLIFEEGTGWRFPTDDDFNLQ